MMELLYKWESSLLLTVEPDTQTLVKETGRSIGVVIPTEGLPPSARLPECVV